MSEMVERVARAIVECGDEATAVEKARAAIEAMREATPAMIDAAFARGWAGAIDAALKDGT